jgi:hypothetical protein
MAVEAILRDALGFATELVTLRKARHNRGSHGWSCAPQGRYTIVPYDAA